MAATYRPRYTVWPKDVPKPTVSVVTPVYNEDPATFEQAMQSWIANGVTEIVAVIDKSNTRHIIDYERRYASNKRLKTKCRMLVTPKPGKRAALCDGIEAATGDIICLVDSDTIWDENVLEKTLPYFLDKQIGGTTVAQRINNPNTIGNVMFDILLYTRYREEVPFLLGAGKVFNTLSGRTAFYRREALLNKDFDNVHNLRHEHFFGTRGISGDDKRLTHLILEQGWHTGFVLGAFVYTPGLGSIKSFLKQRLRWTRNSWRADLRAISHGWPFRHPALAYFMIDRFIQPFFMLIGPVVFVVSLINQEWLFAGILVTWWLLSRFIRLFGYFRRYPARLVYLPAYIVYGYVNAIIKIYALATLIEHSWATRWTANRAARKKTYRKLLTVGSGVVAVFLFFWIIDQFVTYSRARSAADISIPAPVQIQSFTGAIDFASNAPEVPQVPDGVVLPTGVGKYTVQPGDNLNSISAKLGMSAQDLKKLNGILHPDKIDVGQELVYYRTGQ
jgi:cellulose synthase/poly-beta-1,6-N-acetylglucosamine synthase-like glycosyltransferase